MNILIPISLITVKPPGFQRSQAGIPNLDLFGRRDDLDYYGGTDSEDDISNNNLLIRRRPQASDVSLFRRAARRKAIAAPTTHQQQSPTNLLDNILDIQSKFHSRNSVISVDHDGSVKIDKKEGAQNNNNNNTNNNNNRNKANKNREKRVNVNDYANAYFRQAPMYGNGSSSSPVYSNNTDFTRRNTVDNGNAVTTSSEQVNSYYVFISRSFSC